MVSYVYTDVDRRFVARFLRMWRGDVSYNWDARPREKWAFAGQKMGNVEFAESILLPYALGAAKADRAFRPVARKLMGRQGAYGMCALVRDELEE